ncbi:SAM-dependent methyltransferase [Malaciobacter marinus]|uniref:SAM-dependent methyltransferase n=1 Tax=Malaciobacter marinus TaxID=505249 RepID=A0A347TLE3_9BACT|nr:class I SAM-dependent methyltransferase [Malaciobacter marinus]AXX87421.1 SAM-dependent methyltransferase [Malaciobacter marinus]PHO16239.1 SAM-dependent methyltransferase [Malaciobacter marinus]
MNISSLEKIIDESLKNKTQEYKRLFHGRGNFYEDFNYLTIDSIDDIIFATIFEEINKDIEKEIIDFLEKIYENYNYKTLVLQRRYLNNGENEVLKGTLNKQNHAIENGLKYSINFSNKNIGFFADMKKGRQFVYENAKDKKVLNLFSYTCSFSVCAIKGEAKEIVNIDMAKNALNTGRLNHQINNLDTKNVKFLPHNILKSWGKIKKSGPYDIIIIDPPSFQKGSFAATKDYEKIIKRLDSLAFEKCIILSCLNAPELDTSFIKNLFEKFAPEFKYVKRLDNLEEFISKDKEKSLKNMIFEKS